MYDHLGTMLLSGVPALAVAVLGWVWNLSGKTSHIEFLERRLTTLETAMTERNERLDEMAQRLARLEVMLEYLVSERKVAKSVRV